MFMRMSARVVATLAFPVVLAGCGGSVTAASDVTPAFGLPQAQQAATEGWKQQLVKLSPGGNVLGDYTPPGGAWRVAIDAEGNVWTGGQDTVSKLAPNGTVLGTYRTGLASFYDLTIDPAGNVWTIGEEGARVAKLSASGALLGTYDYQTWTPGTQAVPEAIGADRAGNIWVVDGGSPSADPPVPATIVRFAGNGRQLSAVPVLDAYVGGNIVIDDAGNAWVANVGASVGKFAANGEISDFFPAGETPARLAQDARGNLWVADLGTITGSAAGVTKLGPDGHRLGFYPMPHAEDLAVDGSGNVWVTSGAAGTVTKLSSSGAVLGVYHPGPSGSSRTPGGIAVDRQGQPWVVVYDKTQPSEQQRRYNLLRQQMQQPVTSRKRS